MTVVFQTIVGFYLDSQRPGKDLMVPRDTVENAVFSNLLVEQKFGYYRISKNKFSFHLSGFLSVGNLFSSHH